MGATLRKKKKKKRFKHSHSIKVYGAINVEGRVDSHLTDITYSGS